MIAAYYSTAALVGLSGRLWLVLPAWLAMVARRWA